jgi:hypothetical protein
MKLLVYLCPFVAILETWARVRLNPWTAVVAYSRASSFDAYDHIITAKAIRITQFFNKPDNIT